MRDARPRAGAGEMQNKISTFGFKLKFFPPTFIREGGGCGVKFFSDRRGRGGREEA